MTKMTKMTKEHLIKMPSISQFRGVVHDIITNAQYVETLEDGTVITDKNIKLPTIPFIGTVKLHGTNASVCMSKDGVMWAQSKRGVITPEKDNAGFAMFVNTNKDFFEETLKNLMVVDKSTSVEEICIYGEWAGKGIQKGVAISEIEKTFFIFGIKFKIQGEDSYRWAQAPEVVLNQIANRDKRVRSIFEFETYEIEVDFNNPSLIKNDILKITNDIENDCPVGRAYDISGIGEGVVFTGWVKDTKYSFKSKGEKHSTSKVKTLKPVDMVKEQAKIDFANYATPAWRLEQMYQETFDTLNGGTGDIKGTGDFLKAVIKDVMKEELDKMGETGLEPKEVNGVISKIARMWFMEQLDREAFGSENEV